MKKFYHYKAIAIFFVSLILTSCNNDDELQTEGRFDSGFLILSKGSPINSLDHIGEDLQNITYSIFKSVNNRALEKDVSEIIFVDDEAYIFFDYSSQIYIVDRYTFELNEIVSVHNEIIQAVLGDNGDLYLMTTPSFGKYQLLVYENHELTNLTPNTIDLQRSFNKMTNFENMIYMYQNSEGVLSVFDKRSKSIVDEITFESHVQNILQTDQSLFVVTNERVLELDVPSHSIIKSIENLVSEDEIFANFQIVGDIIYFSLGPDVYQIDKNAASFDEGNRILHLEDKYGVATIDMLKVIDDKMLLSIYDYLDAEENSKIHRYDLKGNSEGLHYISSDYINQFYEIEKK